MKKPTLFLFALVLIFAFGFITKVSAQTAGSVYSVVLRSGMSGPEISALQADLNAANNGLSVIAVDGKFGPATTVAIQRFQSSQGLAADGVVGPRTGAALRTRIGPISLPPSEPICPNGMTIASNCTVAPTPISLPEPCPLTAVNGTIIHVCPTPPPIPVPNPNSPVISGVSGPQSLDVNQQGTWSVTASSATGGNLSYFVVWGDEIYTMSATSADQSLMRTPQQSATFTHSYAQAGTYRPVFTVTSENTIRCITTPCPSNAGSAQTSLSVNVGNAVSPSVNVLSPNGGETWVKGTAQTIKWWDNETINCRVGLVCLTPTYDISLTSYFPTCTSNVCPMYDQMIRTIARGVSGSSYEWKIPNCTAGNPCSSNFDIREGSYTIQVCRNGSGCGTSDNYFKIINSGASIELPSISALSPSFGPVGTQVTIYGSGFALGVINCITSPCDAFTNNVNFGPNKIKNIYSQDGTSLTFNVPTYTLPDCLAPIRCEPTPIYPGIYPISVSTSNGTSNSKNFIVTSGTQSNDFYISPSSISLNVGGSVSVKANYQPPMPICSPGLVCVQMMPAPVEVKAIWTLSNNNIAALQYIDCAVLGGCGGSAMVTGVSSGATTLTATYKDSSGTVHTASAPVGVSYY